MGLVNASVESCRDWIASSEHASHWQCVGSLDLLSGEVDG